MLEMDAKGFKTTSNTNMLGKQNHKSYHKDLTGITLSSFNVLFH